MACFSYQLYSIALAISCLLCSFGDPDPSYPGIQLLINGVKVERPEKAISTSQFGQLKIVAERDDLVVTELNLTLSRGNRSVKTMVVKGDTFDLTKLRSRARTGDRLVIEVTQTAKSGGHDKLLHVLAIRID